MRSHELRSILRELWTAGKRTILTTLGILGVVLGLIYGLYTYRENRVRKHLMEADFEKVIDDSAAEERVLSIARRFECVSCDTCKFMPLEVCECRSGKAARNYIRREIAVHGDDSAVVRHVASLFGGLRDPRLK
jgi:hypothetical protein